MSQTEQTAPIRLLAPIHDMGKSLYNTIFISSIEVWILYLIHTFSLAHFCAMINIISLRDFFGPPLPNFYVLSGVLSLAKIFNGTKEYDVLIQYSFLGNILFQIYKPKSKKNAPKNKIYEIMYKTNSIFTETVVATMAVLFLYYRHG